MHDTLGMLCTLKNIEENIVNIFLQYKCPFKLIYLHHGYKIQFTLK
jgi:hypothetical protein